MTPKLVGGQAVVDRGVSFIHCPGKLNCALYVPNCVGVKKTYALLIGSAVYGPIVWFVPSGAVIVSIKPVKCVPMLFDGELTPLPFASIDICVRNMTISVCWLTPSVAGTATQAFVGTDVVYSALAAGIPIIAADEEIANIRIKAMEGNVLVPRIFSLFIAKGLSIFSFSPKFFFFSLNFILDEVNLLCKNCLSQTVLSETI